MVNPVPFPAGIELPQLADASYASNEALPKSVIEAKIAALGSGTVVLGANWKPELEIYPVVDATNGPITSDSGIVAGDGASHTGMTFIPWNAVDMYGKPVFNYQGMVVANAPAGVLSAAGQAIMINAATPRCYFGNTGQYYNGWQDISFDLASSKCYPVWYNYATQISSTKTDMHMLVQHEGKMKHLSDNDTVPNGLPRTLTTGSGIKHRAVVYKTHKMQRHRILLGGGGYFAGIWVDTIYELRRTPNKQLFIHGTDSWNDSMTWSSGDGYSATGSYQSIGMPQMMSFYTGQCHGTDAQGGTGEYNANATSGGDLETYGNDIVNDIKSSAAWSNSRVNWRAIQYGQQYPIFVDIGGWNDGTATPSPYQASYRTRVAARIQKTINACATYNRECRFINVGIEPADVSVGDVKELSERGQQEIPALFPGVVLGHTPILPMWVDNSTSGPRSIYTFTSDHIHLLLNGLQAVAPYISSSMAKFKVDQDYLNKMMTADIPVLTLP